MSSDTDLLKEIVQRHLTIKGELHKYMFCFDDSLRISFRNIPLEAGDREIAQVLRGAGAKIIEIKSDYRTFDGIEVLTGFRTAKIEREGFRGLPNTMKCYGTRSIGIRYDGQDEHNSTVEANNTVKSIVGGGPGSGTQEAPTIASTDAPTPVSTVVTTSTLTSVPSVSPAAATITSVPLAAANILPTFAQALAGAVPTSVVSLDATVATSYRPALTTLTSTVATITSPFAATPRFITPNTFWAGEEDIQEENEESEENGEEEEPQKTDILTQTSILANTKASINAWKAVETAKVRADLGKKLEALKSGGSPTEDISIPLTPCPSLELTETLSQGSLGAPPTRPPSPSALLPSVALQIDATAAPSTADAAPGGPLAALSPPVIFSIETPETESAQHMEEDEGTGVSVVDAIAGDNEVIEVSSDCDDIDVNDDHPVVFPEEHSVCKDEVDDVPVLPDEDAVIDHADAEAPSPVEAVEEVSAPPEEPFVEVASEILTLGAEVDVKSEEPAVLLEDRDVNIEIVVDELEAEVIAPPDSGFLATCTKRKTSGINSDEGILKIKCPEDEETEINVGKFKYFMSVNTLASLEKRAIQKAPLSEEELFIFYHHRKFERFPPLDYKMSDSRYEKSMAFMIYNHAGHQALLKQPVGLTDYPSGIFCRWGEISTNISARSASVAVFRQEELNNLRLYFFRGDPHVKGRPKPKDRKKKKGT